MGLEVGVVVDILSDGVKLRDQFLPYLVKETTTTTVLGIIINKLGIYHLTFIH